MEMADLREKWLIQKAALMQKMGQLSGRTLSPRDWAVLLLAGMLLGVAAKSLAHDTLTMGYDDYRLSQSTNIVDLNVLEKEIIENGGSFATKTHAIPKGDTCTE